MKWMLIQVTIPTLQAHLAAAQAVQRRLGGGTSGSSAKSGS